MDAKTARLAQMYGTGRGGWPQQRIEIADKFILRRGQVVRIEKIKRRKYKGHDVMIRKVRTWLIADKKTGEVITEIGPIGRHEARKQVRDMNKAYKQMEMRTV